MAVHVCAASRLQPASLELLDRLFDRSSKANDDLDVVEGRRTELVGKIQERYGVAKDEAERQVDTWLQNM